MPRPIAGSQKRKNNQALQPHFWYKCGRRLGTGRCERLHCKTTNDACVSVDEDFVPKGDIGVQVVAGGDYAVTTHFGPYHKLGDTYTKLLGQWLPRSGRELRSAPCFEVYLNDPQGTEPEDLLTDIYAPLQTITKSPK